MKLSVKALTYTLAILWGALFSTRWLDESDLASVWRDVP
jgi:hypothetical protein